MTDREKFESLAAECGLDVARFDVDHGDYAMVDTQAAWKVYQAALASDTRRSVEDLEDAIAGYEDTHDGECAVSLVIKWALGADNIHEGAAVEHGRERT